MFELWFGPRLAPVAIPMFTLVALGGVFLVLVRRPALRTVDRVGSSRTGIRP